MRLREKRNILNEAKDLFELNFHPRNTNPASYYWNGQERLRRALAILSAANLFLDQVSAINDLDFLEILSEKIAVNDSQKNQLNDRMIELQRLIVRLLDELDVIIDQEAENLVSVKLPKITSFEDLADATGALEKIFNKSLVRSALGSITIANFDNGSLWIDILIGGGAPAIHFFGALAYSGAVTFKKYQEGKLVQEQVRALKLSNDATEELQLKLKEKQSEVEEIEAKHLCETFFEKSDNEDVEHLKLALREMARLYSKGTEIHPSIAAPAEIKSEFPKMDNLELTESKVKKITEGKD